MEKFTATVGELSFPCSEDEWPIVAHEAIENRQRAYLVRDSDKKVISEG